MIYSILSALLLFFSDGEISSVNHVPTDIHNLVNVINPFFVADTTNTIDERD